MGNWEHVIGFRCIKCNREFKFDDRRKQYYCNDCGAEGTLDVIYDFMFLNNNFKFSEYHVGFEVGIARYAPLLPVVWQGAWSPAVRVGSTPLSPVGRLLPDCPEKTYVKNDALNPTGSLKDRASIVAVIDSLYWKADNIVCASTGNAASSIAGVAAHSGIQVNLLVPEKAPAAKLAQGRICGANVVLVKGTYDQAFDLSMKAVEAVGAYNRSTSVNPVLAEGKKTVAIEIAHELGWKVPDKVFVPVGDGCVLGGIFKGFRDLLELDVIDHIPRIFGVQAEGAAPLVAAFEGRAWDRPVGTVADSISVGVPRDRLKALRAVRESGGAMIAVADREILEAMRSLGRGAGVFAEPAGAAAWAGLTQSYRQGKIRDSETVVAIISGHGLKDVPAAQLALGEVRPVFVDPADAEFYRKAGELFRRK